MTTLIINADDFGYCEAVNYGIISAHQFGLVQSTTLMAAMPGADHAAKLLQANPSLACGVHLTLSCGSPLLTSHKTIVDEHGQFFKRITKDVAQTFDLDEVYAEFCAQIEKAKAYGIELSHLDSHHHVHVMQEFEPVISKLVATYQLPMRGGFEYDAKHIKSVPLMDQFYKDAVNESFFEEFAATIKSYDVVDLMAHPAFLDEFILNSTSYALERTKEHRVLTSTVVKEMLAKHNIQVGNYKQIGE